jgi:flagellar biosynthesis/type III secretory pathway protein FliH
MSKKSQNNDKAEQQALKEAEIVAELAPNQRTRKEAEKLIETIEEKPTTDFHAAEQEIVENVLDQTKKVIGKTTNEAKREIPRYTKALSELQTGTMQTTKEIGYDCIDFTASGFGAKVHLVVYALVVHKDYNRILYEIG